MTAATAIGTLARSSIGKKAVMAATGLFMVLWIFLHMAGNLLVFSGQTHFNRYAAFIQSGFGVEPALVWAMRFALLGCLGAHIWAATALNGRNRAARPVAYQGGRKDRITNPAARNMMLGGLVIALFLLFHLAHLTLGAFSDDAIQHGTFVREDAYRNLVIGLNHKIVGAIYVVAQLALFAHLFHGTGSGFQTLGLDDPRWNFVKTGLGRWVPAIILAGNTAVALACMFGVGTVIDAPDLSWHAPAAH